VGDRIQMLEVECHEVAQKPEGTNPEEGTNLEVAKIEEATNPVVAMNPEEGTNPEVAKIEEATNPVVAMSPVVATKPVVATNPEVGTNPEEATNPVVAMNPEVAKIEEDMNVVAIEEVKIVEAIEEVKIVVVILEVAKIVVVTSVEATKEMEATNNHTPTLMVPQLRPKMKTMKEAATNHEVVKSPGNKTRTLLKEVTHEEEEEVEATLVEDISPVTTTEIVVTIGKFKMRLKSSL